jgi:hypothetical protein
MVVFLAADIGWEDYGGYGNPAVRTRDIDAPAAKGR